MMVLVSPSFELVNVAIIFVIALGFAVLGFKLYARKVVRSEVDREYAEGTFGNLKIAYSLIGFAVFCFSFIMLLLVNYLIFG